MDPQGKRKTLKYSRSQGTCSLRYLPQDKAPAGRLSAPDSHSFRPRNATALPNDTASPASPKNFHPCAGSPVKVFGRVGHGEGEPFSKKVSLPPCKQPASAYTLKNRSRSALLTTEKEDMAMAVPAIMGESMGPPKTCSRPAATGRPSRL